MPEGCVFSDWVLEKWRQFGEITNCDRTDEKYCCLVGGIFDIEMECGWEIEKRFMKKIESLREIRYC